jgi:SNF2 family DNA or RNA helicase
VEPAVGGPTIDRAHRIGQEKTVFAKSITRKCGGKNLAMQLQKRLFNELITTEDTS